MTQHTLAGGEGDIGGEEAAGGGVVVAGLEVVEGGFGVVDVATVAEGLVAAEGSDKGAGGREKLPPAIVGVFHYRCAGRVNELDYISLRIADVVVLRAVVGDGDSVAGGVVMKLPHNTSTATQPLAGWALWNCQGTGRVSSFLMLIILHHLEFRQCLPLYSAPCWRPAYFFTSAQALNCTNH